MTEKYDVVIVGGRVSGTAAATALSERGVKVLVLEAAEFGTDTLSTHLLWPSTLAEIHAVGALPAVEAIGAPRLPIATATLDEITLEGEYPPTDGIAYAMCVRRLHLDAALVERAREVGAELRDRCTVEDVIWSGGRVVGVRYTDADGMSQEIAAALVIGADGRKSRIAEKVGAHEPYRSSTSGRACFFAYWKDGRDDLRHIASQWRIGGLLGTAFPCDGGDLLCLLQPPVGTAADFRGRKAKEAYLAGIRALPGLAARLEGCELISSVRAATDIESYFRHATGPGWALVGDAGHFKDPVTAQGIRDAMRYARLLGEAVAPAFAVAGRVDPALLDQAAQRWEIDRERDCMEIFQFTNVLASAAEPSPLEYELYRRGRDDRDYAQTFLGMFSRSRRPADLFRMPAVAAMTARAFTRGESAPGEVVRDVASQGTRILTDWVERTRVRRAPAGTRQGALL